MRREQNLQSRIGLTGLKDTPGSQPTLGLDGMRQRSFPESVWFTTRSILV